MIGSFDNTRVTGADIVELNPYHDNGSTASLAAKIISTLIALNLSQNKLDTSNFLCREFFTSTAGNISKPLVPPIKTINLLFISCVCHVPLSDPSVFLIGSILLWFALIFVLLTLLDGVLRVSRVKQPKGYTSTST